METLGQSYFKIKGVNDMFKTSITKNISMLLAFLIMFLFSADSNVYAKEKNAVEVISDNVIQVKENNIISIIEIVEDNNSTRTVIQKNDNGRIVGVYIYDKIKDKLNIDQEGKIINTIDFNREYDSLVSPLAWEGGSGCTVGNTRKVKSAKISYGDLLQGAGVVVSLAVLISLVTASAGGATTVSQSIYKAIKKEVIAVTAGVSGFFLKNHGIMIYRQEKCERRCRGSDCYTTYYAKASGWGKY